MPFISSQKVEIADTLKIRLYDFAMSLIHACRDRDALACLLVSKTPLKEDCEFWICACRFNIARSTKDTQDIKSAIDIAQQIVSGKIKVPQRYIEGAGQMLRKLQNQ